MRWAARSSSSARRPIREAIAGASAAYASVSDSATARCDRLQSFCQLAIAIAVCRNVRLEHDRAVSNIDDRECMRVAVRVGTNDVVQLICEHP
jgi:uncharacterized protein with von Willebrand factor type A (vWA) domain